MAKKRLITDTPIFVHSTEQVTVHFPLFYKESIVKLKEWTSTKNKPLPYNKRGASGAVYYHCIVNSEIHIQITEGVLWEPTAKKKYCRNHIDYKIEVGTAKYHLENLEKNQALSQGEAALTQEEFLTVLNRAFATGLRLHSFFNTGAIQSLELTSFIHENTNEIVREIISRTPPENL